MKIKVEILVKDESYRQRITDNLIAKYSNVSEKYSLEIYSATKLNIALDSVREKKIDILLADKDFAIDYDILPQKCEFAWFVDDQGVVTHKGKTAICKFQPVEQIYKQILKLCSDHMEEVLKKYSVGNCRMIAFLSVSGGTGASSLAASAAINLASNGKKVLYLNLERLGFDVFFTGDGRYDLGDVFKALQSKSVNIQMMLESCVKQDKSGVYFFSKPAQALYTVEMFERYPALLSKMLLELMSCGKYETVILDANFGLEAEDLELLDMASRIIWVGDGSETSNSKLVSAYKAVEAIEENREISLLNRIGVIYNKFSKKTCQTVDNIDLQRISGISRYEHLTSKNVVESLSKLDFYSKLI